MSAHSTIFISRAAAITYVLREQFEDWTNERLEQVLDAALDKAETLYNCFVVDEPAEHDRDSRDDLIDRLPPYRPALVAVEAAIASRPSSSCKSLDVSICGDKYTVQQDFDGTLHALRYGQPWRDCTGDGLICALAHEVERLRDELAAKDTS